LRAQIWTVEYTRNLVGKPFIKKTGAGNIGKKIPGETGRKAGDFRSASKSQQKIPVITRENL